MGNTALHYSAILDNLEFFILIEEQGGNIESINKNNEKPIDVCPKGGKVYKYLKDKTDKTKSRDIRRKDRGSILFLKAKKFEVI